MFVLGTIYDSEGKICCQNAKVSLEIMDRNGKTEWFATVSASVGTPMNAGEKYKLVLGDGRSGECMVRRNTSASLEERAISIWGMGELK
jgi:hypothetical protein